MVHPYGLVAHGGRWYQRVDVGRGEDRPSGGPITTSTAAGCLGRPRVRPRRRVLSGLARTRTDTRSAAHPGDGRADPRAPARERGDDRGAAGRLAAGRLRAEELDWVPGVLAMLDRPFVIERPDELRDLVRELAERLVRSAAGSIEH